MGNAGTWFNLSSVSVGARVRAPSLSSEGSSSIPLLSQVPSQLTNVVAASSCAAVH